MKNTIKMMLGQLVKEEANVTGIFKNKDAGFRGKEIKYVSGTGCFTIKLENSSYAKEIKIHVIEELVEEIKKAIRDKKSIHIEGNIHENYFMWGRILVDGIDINRI